MLVETKLNLGDKIYFVYGDPAKQIRILSATISQIKISKNKFSKDLEIEYGYTKIHVEVNKSISKFPADLLNRVGYINENFIDKKRKPNSFKGFSFSDWPTFTTKKQCKEYIRKVIENDKKQKE